MHLKHIYISLLLLFALTLGCKKDQVPCTTCPTGDSNCEDVENVKHFFYFKVGSWWVYEEENSGVHDSVYVTSAAENPSNYDFDVEVYSTYQDYTYRYWPQYSPANGCSINGTICNWCLTIKRAKYKPGDFVAEDKCFVFVPKIGVREYVWTSNLPSNYIEITQIDSVFNLSGETFGRTVRVSELNSYMEGDQPTEHYFSENVGLVRKELIDSNEVWNLVDYNIAE